MSNPIRVAVICSSNMNRSMEAHALLSKKGFSVKSFGTGSKIKLPGPALDRPNCYQFGATYNEIYNDLLKKDKSLYTKNGLLHMIDRNRRIKLRPERFQACKYQFDVIVTCEERVYDHVVEAMEARPPQTYATAHLINIHIEDNHEDAAIGAFQICDLMTMFSKSEDLDDEINQLLNAYEARAQCQILHSMVFY